MGIKPAPTEKLCGHWRGTLLAKYFHERLKKMSLLGRSQFTTSPWWHCVLTTAGFILSMRTMWGEVTHFPLLQTLPSVAGKPWQRTGRDRGNICHKKIRVICCKRINLINIFIEVAALIFKKHCNLHKNVFLFFYE